MLNCQAVKSSPEIKRLWIGMRVSAGVEMQGLDASETR